MSHNLESAIMFEADVSTDRNRIIIERIDTSQCLLTEMRCSDCLLLGKKSIESLEFNLLFCSLVHSFRLFK